jgi:hypothetical protein
MLPEAVVELIGGSASLAVRVVRLRPLDYGLHIPGLKVLNKEVLVLQLVLEVALCRGIVIIFATDIHLVLARVTDVSLEVRAQTHILPKATQVVSGRNQIHMFPTLSAIWVRYNLFVSIAHLRELQAGLGTGEALLEGAVVPLVRRAFTSFIPRVEVALVVITHKELLVLAL